MSILVHISEKLEGGLELGWLGLRALLLCLPLWCWLMARVPQGVRMVAATVS